MQFLVQLCDLCNQVMYNCINAQCVNIVIDNACTAFLFYSLEVVGWHYCRFLMRFISQSSDASGMQPCSIIHAKPKLCISITLLFTLSFPRSCDNHQL
jgi:hypothetical protein